MKGGVTGFLLGLALLAKEERKERDKKAVEPYIEFTEYQVIEPPKLQEPQTTKDDAENSNR